MPKADINKAGWEQSEFPILCETCLGPNPFVRMTKQEFGRSCGTCARPFTVFRWNPGAAANAGGGTRYKSTVVCQTCARVRNTCQTCLLDLEYGLPTQVRDTALDAGRDAPVSDVNREYYAQNVEMAIADGIEGTGPGSAVQQLGGGKSTAAGREMLKELARKNPYYKRNRPHVCSFFVKGTCKRGEECPYRHEKLTDDELARQNIKDRYHGQNDPVAKRMLAGYAAVQGLKPPEDTSIMSLFLSSLPASASEADVRTHIISSLPRTAAPNVRSVVHVAKSRCAFVNFVDRDSAERASEAWAAGLEVGGERVSVRWGRSRQGGGSAKMSASVPANPSSGSDAPSTVTTAA